MSENTLCETNGTNHCENAVTKADETDRSVTQSRDLPTVQPHVDIVDAGEQIFLVADLPGVNETQVDVRVEKKVLTISAETRNDTSDSSAVFAPVHFHRTFALSDEIDVTGIEAVVKAGVLKLTLPKSAQAVSTKIQVRSA